MKNLDIKIASIQKFSTLDFPGKLSCVVFCQGCPNKCVYCHNPDFIDVNKPGNIGFDEFLNFLKTRNSLLEAVVFSGGEALLQKELKEAMLLVKNIGFNVGLHTSGIPVRRFVEVLNVVDWIGFDIKTWFDNYEKITNIHDSGQFAKQSFLELINSNVDFEIRTTFDPRYISTEDLIKIAEFLCENSVKKWILQECILRHNGKNIHLPLPDGNSIKRLLQFVQIEVRKE